MTPSHQIIEENETGKETNNYNDKETINKLAQEIDLESQTDLNNNNVQEVTNDLNTEPTLNNKRVNKNKIR